MTTMNISGYTLINPTQGYIDLGNIKNAMNQKEGLFKEAKDRNEMVQSVRGAVGKAPKSYKRTLDQATVDKILNK